MPWEFNLLLVAGAVFLAAFWWFLRKSIPSVRNVIIAILIVGGAADYLLDQYVFNKGPDDSGAMDYAGSEIIKKHPSYSRAMELLSYEKDPALPTSGDYRFHFWAGGHEGVLICHYDGVSKQFVSSKIEDEK